MEIHDVHSIDTRKVFLDHISTQELTQSYFFLTRFLMIILHIFPVIYFKKLKQFLVSSSIFFYWEIIPGIFVTIIPIHMDGDGGISQLLHAKYV